MVPYKQVSGESGERERERKTWINCSVLFLTVIMARDLGVISIQCYMLLERVLF